MKKISIIALAAIATISSCTKDGLFPDKDGREEIVTGTAPQVFNATMEGFPATRVTLDGMTPSWEVGDVISIDGHSYTAKTAGTSSTFEGTGAGEATHHAYFPAGLYNGGSPALPAVQTYVAGKFDMPMYAESDNTTLSFKNICAVLAIKVTSDDITTLKAIKVASDKKMNGTFTVSDKKAVVGTDGTNVLVLESSTALTLNADGTTFYIAIPAQNYMYLNIYLSSDGETYTRAMATKKAAGLGDIACSKMFSIDYETGVHPFFITHDALCPLKGTTLPRPPLDLWLFSVMLVLISKLDKNDRFYNWCGKASATVIILLGILVWAGWGKCNTDPQFLAGWLNCLYAWLMILAMLGCFRAWFDRTDSFCSYMTRSSFGIYIVHYLVVAALGTMLKEYTCLAPGAIYAVLTVAVLLLSPAIYELIKRIPLVSWCVLGIHIGEK